MPEYQEPTTVYHLRMEPTAVSCVKPSKTPVKRPQQSKPSQARHWALPAHEAPPCAAHNGGNLLLVGHIGHGQRLHLMGYGHRAVLSSNRIRRSFLLPGTKWEFPDCLNVRASFSYRLVKVNVDRMNLVAGFTLALSLCQLVGSAVCVSVLSCMDTHVTCTCEGTIFTLRY